jgi:carbon monoxide dehydrogenase subunit G
MARSESTIRVGISPKAAYEMWADLIHLQEFLPSVLDVKRVGDGAYSVVLRNGDAKETTRVSYSVIEKPRRLVWRSKGGAKWNGEVILRPVSEGTEIRLIIDFEPSAIREHPTERGSVVPTWNVGGDLLAFQNYTEKIQVEEEDTEEAEAEAVGV